MTLFAYLDGVEVATSAIRLRGNGFTGPQVASAADGSMSQGAIVFDDPNGTIAIRGWQVVTVKETDCTTAPVLFYGTVADHTERRGPYRTGAGREIDTTVNDSNGLLMVRMIGSDGGRPSETDTARLSWLLGSSYLSGLVYDRGLVNGAGRTFDAASYYGKYPVDVLNDLIGPRGQIFFTYWDQATASVGLFYDDPSATTNTCTLSLTNVLSERDATHLIVNEDWERGGDPSEVYSRIRYQYAGGVLYQNNTTTNTTFFPVIGPRGLATENSRVGKLSTATTFATRILTRDSAEAVRLRGTLRIPSTQVGLIAAGMRISAHLTHLTGFTAAAFTRIESVTIQQVEGDNTNYDMGLVLSTYGPPGNGDSGPGSTTPFPPAPPGAPSVIQTTSGSSLGGSISALFTNPVTVGDMIVVAIVERDGTILPTADTDPSGAHNYVTFTEIDEGALGGIATQQGMLLYRVVTSDDFISGPGRLYNFGSFAGSGRPKILAWELAGLAAPNAHQKIAAGAGTTFTFPSLAWTGAGIVVGYIGLGSDVPTPYTFIPHDNIYPSDFTNFWQTAVGIDYAVTASGSQVFSGTFTVSGGDNRHEGVVAFFPLTTTVTAPTTGQPWGPTAPNETPNGSIVSFTMPAGWRWAGNTLRVYVDRLDQTAAVTAQDGTAGTFTLGFAPKTGSLIEVYGTGL